jgi:hypothetical protein
VGKGEDDPSRLVSAELHRDEGVSKTDSEMRSWNSWVSMNWLRRDTEEKAPPPEKKAQIIKSVWFMIFRYQLFDIRFSI